MNYFFEKKSNKLLSLMVGICMLSLGMAYGQGQNPVTPTTPQQTSPQDDQQDDVKSNYSDDELHTFIDANKKIVGIQQDGEKQMMQAIESEDIDVNKFNEILTARQNPDQKADASPEQLEAFGKAAQKVMKIQEELQSKAEKAVEDQGMEFQKYQEMMTAYQQDEDLQKRIAQMLGEQQQEQPQDN